MSTEPQAADIAEALAAAVALLTAHLSSAGLSQDEIVGDVPEAIVLRIMVIFAAAVLAVTRTDNGASLLRTAGELAARMMAEDQEGNGS